MATRRTPAKKAAITDTADPAARVLRRFRLVFNAVKSHFRAVETKAGVSGAQLWALSVVRRQPGIGVGDLARAMDIHQSTASNLLRGLIDAGMVVAAREGTETSAPSRGWNGTWTWSSRSSVRMSAARTSRWVRMTAEREAALPFARGTFVGMQLLCHPGRRGR
jgi:DNA-binding transcriptional ArsR family regulator